MHILHGTWLMDRSVFAFWGEDARFDVPVRKGTRRSFEPHPFGLHQSHRLNYILDVLPEAEPQGGEVSLLLPGRGTSVQPSPEAQSVGMPPLTGALSLLQWQLDTITLDPYEIVQFLLHLPPPNVQHAQFIVGADIAYWRQAALLLMNMLIEGSFMAGINQQGKRYEAFWRHSLSAETLTAFTRSMPPLCRAVTKQVNQAPQPDSLLDHFLTTTLNTLIRRSTNGKRRTVTKSKWITALLHEDRVIQDTPLRNEKRYKQWRAWSEPETLSTQAGAFRVCFRLDEPQDERNRWMLAYMLQARDDHSLLVDAINVWNATGRTANFVNRRFDQPQENMLLALGTASRLFTPIEASLRESKPVGVILKPEQAYDFLTEGVAKLEKAGFGVLVPNWWKRRTKVKAKAKLKGVENASHGLLSRDSLISYEWQMSVGEHGLTPEEFEELVQLRQPFLRLHGQWIALDAEQVKAMLEFMQQHPAGKATLLETLELGADADDKVEIEAPDAEGWLNDALEKLRNPEHAAVPSLPAGLNAKLRPYQERGFGWLNQMRGLNLGGILADSMGLGKAQPLDAKILTPRGWKCMGEIVVGDQVINSEGKTSNVIGVYPQGEIDIYRVIFRDGSSTECSDDHLWSVISPSRRAWGGTPLVRPLHEIRQQLFDGTGNCKYYIPMIKPVEFEPVELPMDPYLLGILIGDGGMSKQTVILSTADAEILQSVKQLVPNGIEVRKISGKYDYRLAMTGLRHLTSPLQNSLRQLGLMGCRSADKFIPDIYRYSSVQSRTRLLQGLLDTDGSISKDNVIEISSASERLTLDIREIVESLGGIARMKSRVTWYTYKGERKQGQRSYRLIIALPTDIQPFSLSRKAERYHPRPKYPPSRAIVDVVFVGRKPAQCIAVDAPDKLYVTDHFILTHNTVQAITLWLHETERLGTDRPRLLVAPTSVVGNWRHELAKFAPSLDVYVHQGADRVQGEEFEQAVAQTDVVLTSYPLLSRDLDTLKRIQWTSITLDEAQNIKNPVTKTAQAARAIPADHRLALTGTPVENRLAELWSIMHFLNPGYLGSREKFRERFSLPIERYSDEAAAKKLKTLTTPFILRRLKTDPKIISDLPEKFENKVYCTLTSEQATLYEAVVREEMEEIDQSESAMQRRGGILRMLTRLKQICNHPAHFLKEGEALGVKALEGRSGKLTRLTEILDEVISSDDRSLIFTQYAEMGKHLQAYLAEQFNTDVMFLFGDTPVEKRMEMVGRFQSPRGPLIFVLSLKAGGTGLNLTNANTVIHYDRWYNPAVEDQATDRAFRIGQTRNVQVNKMICLGTLEERIDELIERKRGLADKIVGEGEGWLSELSNDDLRDLVTLRREALEGNDA